MSVPANTLKPRKVSAVLITFNEEENIERCLSALRWCDEIVVVDSGSTDRTRELCRQFGCRFEHRPFNGYGPQKQYAVSLATHDWVLSVDADEFIPPALRDEMRSELSAEGAPWSGFMIPRTMVFLGREFRFGSEHRAMNLRLFRKSRGGFTGSTVHEKVEIHGPVRELRASMLHYSYRSIHQYFEKFNSYTTAAARELYERRKRRHPLIIGLSLPLNFLKHYVVKGNLLNGYPGFLWAVLSSLYPVVKYAKLTDLYRTSDRGSQ